MKSAYDVIIRPIVTEASYARIPSKKYTFEVHKDATKPEIAKAIEEIFKGVEVKSVNIVNVKSKPRNYGRFSGYTRTWKKAIVTFTEDSKTIAAFDDVN